MMSRHYPTGNGDAAVEFTVDPAKLHDVFAADLPDELTPLAERAGATITEVEGSHVIMISQPDTITDVILKALATAAAPAPVA